MCQGGKEEYDKHETKTRKNEINVGDVSSVMYLLIKDLVYQMAHASTDRDRGKEEEASIIGARILRQVRIQKDIRNSDIIVAVYVIKIGMFQQKSVKVGEGILEKKRYMNQVMFGWLKLFKIRCNETNR